MFITQFQHIGVVGRLRRCRPEGDVTLKKFTLLFGENGRGKSTLCAILRSLQSNNPDIIAGRKTLGETANPTVILKLDGEDARFISNAWQTTSPAKT